MALLSLFRAYILNSVAVISRGLVGERGDLIHEADTPHAVPLYIPRTAKIGTNTGMIPYR